MLAEKVEKLSSELEAMKEKNQRLKDQITFYQKFDFEHQLGTLIELQKSLLDLEKRGNYFKFMLQYSRYLQERFRQLSKISDQLKFRDRH